MLEPKDPGGPPGIKAPSAGSGISFEQFTEATLGAVSRVVIANRGVDHPLYKFPHITMGIIWRPDFPDTTQFPGSKG